MYSRPSKQMYSYKDIERRSKIVWECCVCACRTNLVRHVETYEIESRRFVGRDSGEVRCRYEDKTWHIKIEEKLMWLLEKPHPERYAKELIREIFNQRHWSRHVCKDDISGVIGKNIRHIKPDFEETSSLFLERWKWFAPELWREFNMEKGE